MKKVFFISLTFNVIIIILFLIVIFFIIIVILDKVIMFMIIQLMVVIIISNLNFVEQVNFQQIRICLLMKIMRVK